MSVVDVGYRSNRLEVISSLPCNKYGNKMWLCQCDCGNLKGIREYDLARNKVMSCGCYRTEKIIKRSIKFNTFKPYSKDKVLMLDDLGNSCIIDLEDVEKVKDVYWSLTWGYWISQRNKSKTRLHRFLLNITDPKSIVDHIDGNTSNNSKDNLRICTMQQNGFNHKVARNNTTGVTGVVFAKRKNKYLARIKINGKTIFLGYFKNLEDAKKARLNAEKEYFGEFRRNK